MADLTITYDEIRRYVGRFLGMSRTTTVIDADSNWNTDVDDSIRSGLREFYWPRGEGMDGYIWSFMVQDASLSIPANAREVPLPDNFSKLVSDITFDIGSDNKSLAIVTESEIRAMYARADQTGTPLYGAIDSARMDQGQRSSYVLMMYPYSTTALDLIYSFSIEPDDINSGNGVPLGGALHSETILEACLAGAEKVLNPESGEGIHTIRFKELLRSSVASDRDVAKSSTDSIWPLDVVDGAVTDLTINKRYLERLIGNHMGYGANSKTWNHRHASEVDEVLRTGLRKFYSPMVLPGERYSHQWSFLFPITNLGLKDGQSTYDLPDNFSMLNGSISFAPGDSVLYPDIKIVGEEQLRYSLQRSSAGSRPVIAAVVVQQPDPTVGTRYEIMFFPVPEVTYTVLIPYKINPNILESGIELPLGGQPHAQTLIEACYTSADLFLGRPSQHEKEFQDCLAASISHDREVASPDTLGYNWDRSDAPDDFWLGGHHWLDENVVTYNNVEY